jgi:hypothetical protein
MDITEALEAALAEVKAAIPGAQAEAEKAARHVAALLDEERGLQLALARRTASAGASTTVKTVGVDAVLVAPPTEPAAPEIASAEPYGDWTSLNHMDAVQRALTEAKRPLSPQDIVRALRAVGRSDSNEQVRAALAALKRRGRVSLPARAQWVATVEPSGAQAVIAAALAATPEAQRYHPVPFDPRRSEPNGSTRIPADDEDYDKEVMR